jgi:Fe-S-cluster containining protein
MATFDFNQWQLQVSEQFSLLSGDSDSVSSLLTGLERLFATTETLIQQHEDGDRSLLACRAGCQDCCVVNVSITLLEGIAISRFIQQWGETERTEVEQKLDTLWRAVRGLEDDERLMVRKKCAFLDKQGCCTIYPVRPLFCRSISSTDVEACRGAVTGQIFGDTEPVLMHQFQLQLYKTAFFTVADGLEQAELDGRSFQLCGLVRYLLSHPEQDEDLLVKASLCWDDLYP